MVGLHFRYLIREEKTNIYIRNRDYFIATGAIYLLSLAISQIKTYLIHGRHKASIDLLPCGLICIRIPTIITWSPGQHIFIRFLSPQLGLHCLTSHPFTVSSLSHNPETTGKPNEIILYLKSRGGLTGRLAMIASQHPGASTTVLLEGPYGGVSQDSRPGDARFDTICVIAGGAGAGFSLGIMEAAMRAATKSKIRVVYATRSMAIAEWFRRQIEDLLTRYRVDDDRLSVSIHVTTDYVSETGAPDTQEGSDKEKAGEDIKPVPSNQHSSTEKLVNTVQIGPRPDLPAVIASITEAGKGKRVGVYVCGAASMLHDVRNAAAEAQRKVLAGGVEEIYLHTEPFS